MRCLGLRANSFTLRMSANSLESWKHLLKSTGDFRTPYTTERNTRDTDTTKRNTTNATKNATERYDTKLKLN
jgi:hypothetical protein